MSNYKKRVEKAKFAGVHGVRKHPKIKVNNQMYDVIFLDIAPQVTIFKQNDNVDFFYLERQTLHSV